MVRMFKDMCIERKVMSDASHISNGRWCSRSLTRIRQQERYSQEEPMILFSNSSHRSFEYFHAVNINVHDNMKSFRCNRTDTLTKTKTLVSTL